MEQTWPSSLTCSFWITYHCGIVHWLTPAEHRYWRAYEHDAWENIFRHLSRLASLIIKDSSQMVNIPFTHKWVMFCHFFFNNTWNNRNHIFYLKIHQQLKTITRKMFTVLPFPAYADIRLIFFLCYFKNTLIGIYQNIKS